MAIWTGIGLSGKFNPDEEIQDLSGKVIVVTGGNVGLGRETVFQLAKHKPKHIYLAARTESKAKNAIRSIQAEVPNALVSWLPLDLSSFSSIKDAATTLNQEASRLDLLINNAGVVAAAPAVTKENFEVDWGTNHVGHALLIKLVLPTMLKTAREPGSDVRIINLSSAAAEWVPKGGILWDELKTNMKDYSAMLRYGQSKLANALYTRSLAKRYPDIKTIAVHPGAVVTNLSSGAQEYYPLLAPFLKFFVWAIATPVQKGAWNQLWAATSRDAESGKLYYPVGQVNKGGKYGEDEELAEKLWEWTEQELKEHGFS